VKRAPIIAATWRPTRRTRSTLITRKATCAARTCRTIPPSTGLPAGLRPGLRLPTRPGTGSVSAAEQAKALGKLAANDRFTYVANQGLLYNARHEYTSNGGQLGSETTRVPFVRNHALVPYKTNFGGPGTRTSHDYRVGQFTSTRWCQASSSRS